MMQLYPEAALERLEFNKVKELLLAKCRMEIAKEQIKALRFHTRIDFVERALQQANEYKFILSTKDHFPNDFTTDVTRDLKTLAIEGAVLSGEKLRALLALTYTIKDIHIWFKNHGELFPYLRNIIAKVEYEKEIVEIINPIVDEDGKLRDSASQELMQIRIELDKQRGHLRKVFESVIRKLNKQGYLADISEGYLNNRRTVAINAENKRIVKGIFHGESEGGRIIFIEPEETIELNNEVAQLERTERKEIQRILAETTAKLSFFEPDLSNYYLVCGVYDFIRAKALLAQDMNATMPRLSPHPGIHLENAFHPILLLHNQEQGKITYPLNISLNRQERILMISGPNAGGKTVSMKTVGLLQIMVQSGLLIPASEQSEIGIFKQIMIHIGDTQSIENELSTYSAHLKEMKYFLEFANGKTLFFIDELGSGSDPNLGGAFAEAIVEQLADKKAMGIITTHYLNLKVMAGKVKGIFNGAMAFDEAKLEPLYQLNVGKPGSSYTFAIAQRSRLPEIVIERAREITDRGHFKLDSMLHQTEQQSVRLGDKEKYLDKLVLKNENLKTQYESLIDKERLKQQYETLKLQNKIRQDEIDYYRDLERKFKQIVMDWKKSENKSEVIESAEKILFKKKAIQQNQIAASKADKKYQVTGKEAEIGDFLRNKTNHQIGKLVSIDGKKGIVKIGKLPFTIILEEWVTVLPKKSRKKNLILQTQVFKNKQNINIRK